MAEQDVTDAFLDGDGDTPAAEEQEAAEEATQTEESPSETEGGDEGGQEPGAQEASPETPAADKPVDWQKRHADAEKKLNAVLAERDKLKPLADKSEALEQKVGALELAAKLATEEPESPAQDADAKMAQRLVDECGFQSTEEATRYLKVHRIASEPTLERVTQGQSQLNASLEWEVFVKNNPDWKKHEGAMAEVVKQYPHLKRVPRAAETIYALALKSTAGEDEKALEAKIRKEIAEKAKEAGAAPNTPGEGTGPVAGQPAKSEHERTIELLTSDKDKPDLINRF